jgi:DNA-binding protein HU-beta
LTKKQSGAALNAVLETIQGALAKGDSIGLIGFGTFEVRTRAARDGRNPQTGAPIKIDAKKVPAFKAGKKLKDAIVQ